jgi:hypothetical protein
MSAVGIAACVGLCAVSVALADPPATAQGAGGAKPPTVTIAATPDREERGLLAAGYRPEMHDGEKVYCRMESDTGSRLDQKKVCGTAQQIEAARQATQDYLSQSLRHQFSGGK